MRSSTEAKAVVARAGRCAEVDLKSDDRDDLAAEGGKKSGSRIRAGMWCA